MTDCPLQSVDDLLKPLAITSSDPHCTVQLRAVEVRPPPPFPATIAPQPTGVGSIGFTVPDVPSLVGQPIYVQSVLIADPYYLRLRNVVAGVIQ